MASLIDYLNEASGSISRISKNLDELDRQYVQLSKQAQNYANVSKQTASATATAQNQRAKSLKNLTILEQERLKLRKALYRQHQRFTIAQTQLAKNYERLKLETRQQNKLNREEAVLKSRLSTAYQKLVVTMNQTGRAYQDLLIKKMQQRGLSEKEEAQLRKLGRQYQRYHAQVMRADTAINRHYRNVGNYSSALGKGTAMLRNFAGAFGLIGGVYLFADMVKSGFELTKTLQGLDYALEAVTDSAEEFARVQDFLQDITEKYGTDIVTTTERYTKFLTAAKQSNLAMEDTEKIFEAVTKASGVLGLKTHELEGVYLALEQMLSKGKVTTEELRRQLGERLPGAFGIMAQAIGVSVQELDKMLKAGEVLSADALPKFAAQVEKAYGIENINRVDTLTAATQRLSNTWVNFVRAVSLDTGFDDTLTGIVNGMANMLKTIGGLKKETNEYIKSIRKEQTELNVLTNNILELNEEDENRQLLMGELIEKYPFLLNYIDDEKAGNDELEKALVKVNDMYLKRLVLTKIYQNLKIEEKTDKVASAQAKATMTVTDYNNYLNKLNTNLMKIGAGEETLTGTIDEKTKALKENMVAYQVAVAQDTDATDKQKANAQRLYSIIEQLNNARNSVTRTDTQAGFAEDELNEATSALEEYEKALGMTKQQIDDFFNGQDPVVITVKLKKPDPKEAARLKEQATRDRYELEMALRKIAQEGYQDEIENTDLSIEERLSALKKYQTNAIKMVDTQTRELKRKHKGRKDAITRIEQEAKHEKEQIQQEVQEMEANIYESDFTTRLSKYEAMVEKEAIMQEAGLLKKEAQLRANGVKEEEIQKIMNQERNKLMQENTLRYLDYLEIELLATAKTEEEKLEIIKRMNDLRAKAMKSGTDATKDQAAMEKQLWGELYSSLKDFANNMFAQKIQHYDDEIERNRDHYAQILDNEQLTQEQREAIQDERDKKERELEKRKREEQRKQAIFNKVLSVAEIAINTARAISEASPNPFLMALAAAVGVAQTAAALATPIPRYEKGKGDYDNYEGVAIWGEKRRELKIGEDGRVELSPKKIGNHLTYVKKNDTIIPDADKFFQQAHSQDRVLLENPLVSSSIASSYRDSARMIVASQERNTREVVRAVNKIKTKINLTNKVDIGEDLRWLKRQQDIL